MTTAPEPDDHVPAIPVALEVKSCAVTEVSAARERKREYSEFDNRNMIPVVSAETECDGFVCTKV